MQHLSGRFNRPPRRLAKAAVRRLIDHYYWAGKRTFYQRLIRQRYRQRASEVLRTSEPALYQSMREMLAALGLDVELPHKKFGDALFLLTYFRQHRPRLILECGAGLSTLVFAYAMNEARVADGYRGRIISMEQDNEFLKYCVQPYLTDTQLQNVEFHSSSTAQEYFLDEKTGVGYIGDFYTDVPINAYDLIFIDGPVNHHGVQVALPDSTRITERGKTFSADYLNVLRTIEETVPVVIDQRLDTRWKIVELVHGSQMERYHYAAMKFEIAVSPKNVAALKRLPVQTIDKGESLYLPLGQKSPPRPSNL